MDTKSLLLELVSELDDVKRYVANTYEKTDTEIEEIRQLCRNIDKQLNETDRQIDKIERFDRDINEMKSMMKQIEKKMR